MIKSMNLYFNNHIPTKDKLDKIKEQGYDQYFTGLNRKGENISIKNTVGDITFIQSVGEECKVVINENIKKNYGVNLFPLVHVSIQFFL